MSTALRAAPERAPLVLLIDHDDDSRAMYVDYLEQAGWRIAEATDGPEGLARALSERPDLIVTEGRLPGISGYELCRLLRRDPVTRTVPIVFVMADALPRDIELARAAGATSVLSKPCLPEALLAEGRRQIDLSRELAGQVRTSPQDSRNQIDRAGRVLTESGRPAPGEPAPAAPPPSLICPSCDRTLEFRWSHVGGVGAKNHEQWDYFACPSGCGEFQYRHRTRKLRKV